MLIWVSNVDFPPEVVFCDRGEIDDVGVDNRKRGLGKMLDIKEHEEWPLIVNLRLTIRGHFFFYLGEFGVRCIFLSTTNTSQGIDKAKLKT